MSKLEAALGLARRGFHVFPLIENSKLPAIKDFPNRATRDEEKIKAWWLDPVLEIEKDLNIGISTSKFRDNESLVVIDVDTKNGKKGEESLELLDLLGHDVPDTCEQGTPTNGRHLIYWHKEALKQGVDVLGDGLDVRSKGGYIVGAGSTIDGKEYSTDATPLFPAPEWLVSQLGKAPEKSEVDAPENINEENAYRRAVHYLAHEAPESVKGAGGDQTAYRVAAKVKDFGVSEADCLELMMEHWFEGSGWSPERLQEKIAHAYQYGLDPVGSDAPEAHFEKIEASEEIHFLDQINKKYALVFFGGAHSILHETVDEKGNDKTVFLAEQTFKRKYSAHTLQKRGTWATEWLEWPNRKEYAGVVFAPEREARHNYYNMWRGFTVEELKYDDANSEQRKGFDDFISHVKDNICNKNLEHFNWLVGYFAHLIQKPYERPLTSLVFKGSKGVGKNAFVDRIGNLLGDGHYATAHDGRYLTSNFNGHLEACLCLVLDEAFWSGDKAAEGKLKGITTSTDLIIERKGKESYKADNLVRIVVIGNEDWLVPASADERRYAVYEVGEGRKQDNKFFHDMRVNMDDKGGNRILLHYLKNFDLNSVDVNRAPKTNALLDQKLSSLEPLESWWFDCLVNGHIVDSDFGDSWPEKITTKSFRNAFARNFRERNIRSRVPDERSIGRLFKKFATAPRTKRRDGENTVWVYKLPELEMARKEWEKYINQEVTWE